MIWASDPHGAITYVSPEWQEFTGQSVADAAGWGWMEVVCPEDLPIIAPVWKDAIAQQREFWTICRLRRPDSEYTWVMGGAVPSRSPITHEFLGFLGSVTEVDLRGPISAQGELDTFRQPPPHPNTAPKSHLDMLADLAIVARSIADEADYGEIIGIVDQLTDALRARRPAGGGERLM